jgi:rhodanese-related sulfurtransferase
MNRFFIILVAAAFFAASALVFSQSIGWSVVNMTIGREFPEVPRIKTSELADWLKDEHRKKPLLLDVRTEAEFKVSHLAGAKRIEPGSETKVVAVPHDSEIVTYCSVGYRSAAFAKRLRTAGFMHVSNLEGSIFQWANENRPLVRRRNEPTNKVHPYNRFWGTLVEKSHRADAAAMSKTVDQ